MKRFVVAVVLLYAAAALAGDTSKDVNQGPHYVMWHLYPVGEADADLARRAETAIRIHFEKLLGKRLMPQQAMDALLMVEGNEDFLRCGTGTACLARLGKEAQAERVIGGEVEKKGGTVTYRLVLIGCKDAIVINRAEVVGTARPSKYLLEEMAVAMLEPERYVGSLHVSTRPAGAAVFLDGQPVGTSPVRVDGIAVGAHRVKAARDGFLAQEKEVRIPYSNTAEVELELIEIAPPPRPFWADWPFWTATGAAVVLFAVGGGLHYDAGVLEDNAQKFRDANQPQKAAEYQDRADKRKLQAYVMYGLGGAGALAAGVIVIIDAATRGGGSSRSSGAEAGKVGLSPVVLDGGAGVSLSVRF
ncbi:MAG: PEGA domain-containing protein [Deltaproteobacteria bacterium]|nr:MAG: PEGA domain-containing protein [Deltaproteobacteria bacterium]